METLEELKDKYYKLEACKKHHVAMGYNKLPKVIKEFEL